MTKAIPLLIAFLAGCPSNADSISPQQACDDVTSALCERLYACFQPSELAAAGYPSSESACITMMQAAQGCTAKTQDNVCTGNAVYQPDEAARCSDQVTGLTCAQIRDPFFDTQTAAPACASVCKVPS